MRSLPRRQANETSADSPKRTTTDPSDFPRVLSDHVPSCAQSCLSAYITQQYDCTNGDVSCLCSQYGNSGFTLGELALVCVSISCPSANQQDPDPAKAKAYDICAAQHDAAAATQQTLIPPATSSARTSRSFIQTTTTATISTIPEPTSTTRSTDTPSATTTSAPPEPTPERGAITSGQAIGISVAAVGFVLIAVTIFYAWGCIRRRKREAAERATKHHSYDFVDDASVHGSEFPHGFISHANSGEWVMSEAVRASREVQAFRQTCDRALLRDHFSPFTAETHPDHKHKMEYKCCNQCGQTQQLSEFTRRTKVFGSCNSCSARVAASIKWKRDSRPIRANNEECSCPKCTKFTMIADQIKNIVAEHSIYDIDPMGSSLRTFTEMFHRFKTLTPSSLHTTHRDENNTSQDTQTRRPDSPDSYLSASSMRTTSQLLPEKPSGPLLHPPPRSPELDNMRTPATIFEEDRSSAHIAPPVPSLPKNPRQPQYAHQFAKPAEHSSGAYQLRAAPQLSVAHPPVLTPGQWMHTFPSTPTVPHAGPTFPSPPTSTTRPTYQQFMNGNSSTNVLHYYPNPDVDSPTDPYPSTPIKQETQVRKAAPAAIAITKPSHPPIAVRASMASDVSHPTSFDDTESEEETEQEDRSKRPRDEEEEASLIADIRYPKVPRRAKEDHPDSVLAQPLRQFSAAERRQQSHCIVFCRWSGPQKPGTGDENMRKVGRKYFEERGMTMPDSSISVVGVASKKSIQAVCDTQAVRRALKGKYNCHLYLIVLGLDGYMVDVKHWRKWFEDDIFLNFNNTASLSFYINSKGGFSDDLPLEELLSDGP
ncbi:unnamed protein product [Zymoseptoria tritici ST99CH_1A5]|uniref:CFEM domain-containing protein n=1 Tax=Zymoseptoria tritici ST99CH_1A5 TaxID=1276529 RepID=A0A1Y6L839_ZYMTR|nr:unnamed protein product [Zymoseptoria tritici ST99CH_1A5]